MTQTPHDPRALAGRHQPADLGVPTSPPAPAGESWIVQQEFEADRGWIRPAERPAPGPHPRALLS